MEPNPYQVAQAMTQIMETLGPLREAAGGYRRQLIADGWPEADASRVAAELLIEM